MSSLNKEGGYIEPKRPFQSGKPYPPEYRPRTIRLPDSKLNELRMSLANDVVALSRRMVELADRAEDEKRKDPEYARLFYTVALKQELLAPGRAVDTTKLRGKLYTDNNGWLDSLAFDDVCRRISTLYGEEDLEAAA